MQVLSIVVARTKGNKIFYTCCFCKKMLFLVSCHYLASKTWKFLSTSSCFNSHDCSKFQEYLYNMTEGKEQSWFQVFAKSYYEIKGGLQLFSCSCVHACTQRWRTRACTQTERQVQGTVSNNYHKTSGKRITKCDELAYATESSEAKDYDHNVPHHSHA